MFWEVEAQVGGSGKQEHLISKEEAEQETLGKGALSEVFSGNVSVFLQPQAELRPVFM